MERDSRRPENTALRLQRKAKTRTDMKTTPILAVSYSAWGSENIPGDYVLRPVPQFPYGEFKWIVRTRWMEPCFLPTISCSEHHKRPNSTISSLLTSEFRIK
jgi:hypothetical protein